MIDATASLSAAENLPGSALANYLRHKGWTARSSRVSGMTILALKLSDADEEVQLIVPEAPGFSDEQRRVADGLRTVGIVEGRPLAELASDVRDFVQIGDLGYAAEESPAEIEPFVETT